MFRSLPTTAAARPSPAETREVACEEPTGRTLPTLSPFYLVPYYQEIDDLGTSPGISTGEEVATMPHDLVIRGSQVVDGTGDAAEMVADGLSALGLYITALQQGSSASHEVLRPALLRFGHSITRNQAGQGFPRELSRPVTAGRLPFRAARRAPRHRRLPCGTEARTGCSGPVSGGKGRVRPR